MLSLNQIPKTKPAARPSKPTRLFYGAKQIGFVLQKRHIAARKTPLLTRNHRPGIRIEQQLPALAWRIRKIK